MLTTYSTSEALFFHLRNDCSLPFIFNSEACVVPGGTCCSLCGHHYEASLETPKTFPRNFDIGGPYGVVSGNGRPLTLPCVWVRFSVELLVISAQACIFLLICPQQSFLMAD